MGTKSNLLLESKIPINRLRNYLPGVFFPYREHRREIRREKLKKRDKKIQFFFFLCLIKKK